MTETVQLFLALLTVACQLFVAVVVVLRLLALRPAWKGPWNAVATAVSPYAIPLAFSVATVTTLGSLYMSEVAGYNPCFLCWVQRAFVYPQVLLTAVLWLRPAWAWLRGLSVIVAIGGIGVSAYHYLIEWGVVGESSCDPNNPCAVIWFRELGYITLPLMALTAGLTIATLLLLSWRRH